MESAAFSVLNQASVWVGFIFSLLILSSILGDHALARFAHHVLVGAAFGYAVVIAYHHVLQPRIIAPLQAGDTANLAVWTPLVLGVILVVAGLDRTGLQQAQAPRQLPSWRRGLAAAGRLPVALLLGVGVGVAIVGTLQGTLFPQYMRAGEIGFAASGPSAQVLTGVLTLVLTTGALLSLFVDVERHLANAPAAVSAVMAGWLWVGKRALWFAAGLVFARLLAARLSVLIAQFEALAAVLHNTVVGEWLAQWWQSFGM
jgi:hypothetical protein